MLDRLRSTSARPLSARVSLTILWASAVAWGGALVLYGHRPSLLFAALTGVFAFVVALTVATVRDSRLTPPSPALSVSNVLVALGVPVLLTVLSTDSLRGGDPIGLAAGLSGAFGFAFCLAAGHSFTWVRWTETAAVEQAHRADGER